MPFQMALPPKSKQLTQVDLSQGVTVDGPLHWVLHKDLTPEQEFITYTIRYPNGPRVYYNVKAQADELDDGTTAFIFPPNSRKEVKRFYQLLAKIGYPAYFADGQGKDWFVYSKFPYSQGLYPDNAVL